MGHHEGEARDWLTGEHRLGDAGQAVIALLFAALWIADTFFLKATTFLNHGVSVVPRIVAGACLIALSGYLAMTSHRILFKEARRETPGVIREGALGVIRHPLYLSEILLYLGLLVWSLSLAAAAIWVAGIAFLHWIARYEEKLLLARFGEEYARYMREVPMWIPRLRRAANPSR